MNAPTKGSKGGALKWVGRAIRRLEDPALVTGQGRFTADLAAAHWVRFVRSPNAAGTIESITAPSGTLVITADDLKGVKKITPMLHKFHYRPVGQPILAEGVVRFVGEAIAAVVAPSEEEAEDIADLVRVVISESRPLVDARDALAEGAPQIHG
jgi:carbon-monoxide dehydrogenase large subunit